MTTGLIEGTTSYGGVNSLFLKKGFLFSFVGGVETADLFPDKREVVPASFSSPTPLPSAPFVTSLIGVGGVDPREAF